ncbi:MAG: AAA family ATPase [Clostridiales bacterium]|nr:AAA family ATPase [Clostridiales bacterium]
MKRLILVGGTMGVGKTAASLALTRILPDNVFLDGDWCWKMAPFVVTDTTKAMVMDNITHLLSNFLRCDAIENVIFCWVMHEQAIIDGILARLPLDGVSVSAFSLVCSETALRERLAGDVAAGLRTEDVIERSIPRLSLYEELDTVKVDTTALSPEETAERIKEML